MISAKDARLKMVEQMSNWCEENSDKIEKQLDILNEKICSAINSKDTSVTIKFYEDSMLKSAIHRELISKGFVVSDNFITKETTIAW